MTNTDIFSKSASDQVTEALPDGTQGLETKEISMSESNDGKRPPPLKARLFAVALIACISFGSHWSSGVTSAMKSTIKKVRTGMSRLVSGIKLTHICYAENEYRQRPIRAAGSK